MNKLENSDNNYSKCQVQKKRDCLQMSLFALPQDHYEQPFHRTIMSSPCTGLYMLTLVQDRRAALAQDHSSTHEWPFHRTT